jgi:hypothetical protein
LISRKEFEIVDDSAGAARPPSWPAKVGLNIVGFDRKEVMSLEKISGD